MNIKERRELARETEVLAMLRKAEAEKVMRRSYVLRAENDGLVLTDLAKTYFAKRADFDAPDAVLAHNQCWTLAEIDELPTLPEWVDTTLASVAQTLDYQQMLTYPDRGREGRYASSRHNRFTGCWHGYASTMLDALWSALRHGVPLEDIYIEDAKLIYDNGDSGFTGHPIQIWSDGKLTKYGSSSRQKTPGFGEEVDILLRFAMDGNAAYWEDRWPELLGFRSTIGPFQKLAEKTYRNLTTRETHELEYAVTSDDKYVLVRWSWGGLYGGEGDAGDTLYLFEKANVGNVNNLPALVNIK